MAVLVTVDVLSYGTLVEVAGFTPLQSIGMFMRDAGFAQNPPGFGLSSFEPLVAAPNAAVRDPRFVSLRSRGARAVTLGQGTGSMGTYGFRSEGQFC